MVGVAVNVTGVPSQIGPEGVADIFTLAGNNGFTVIVIILEVAGLPVAQVAVDVIITVIWSPLTRLDEVYVAPVSPGTVVVPLYHWYDGVPPLVGMAVKITGVPSQIAPDGEAEIFTLAGSKGFTVMVIILDVAGLPVAQVAVEVIFTEIGSPLARPVEV